MMARSWAQARPAGPAPTTATLRPRPALARSPFKIGKCQGVLLPQSVSSATGVALSGPKRSQITRFRARMATGESILPRRQLSSHGAAHTRAQTDAQGLGERAT